MTVEHPPRQPQGVKGIIRVRAESYDILNLGRLPLTASCDRDYMK